MIKHENGNIGNDGDDMETEKNGATVSDSTETVTSNPSMEDEGEEDLILKFEKPFNFEGRIYNEVDLSGFEDVDAELLCNLERSFSKKGISSIQPEVSVSYAVMLAASVCELPVEFFNKLPGKEAIKLKNMVVNFFYA